MLLFLSPTLFLLFLPILTLIFIIHHLRSPLRLIPGPVQTLFTSIPLKLHEFSSTRTSHIHALHLRYGPVVRIAPNEIAFASRDAVKEIYESGGGSGYDKTGFYDLFRVYGRRTMFSTLKREDHAKRKRLLAARYANSNVIKPEALGGIEERASKVVGICERARGKSVDLYIMLHAYAFDCVSHHLFHPYGANSLENPDDEAIMREVAFDSSVQNRLVSYYAPSFHRCISRILDRIAPPRETPLADNFVIEAASRTDSAPFTILNNLHDKGKAVDLEQLTIAAECLDHMAAGIDTTGDALCFLMWELSQPRSIKFQHELHQELYDNQEKAFDKLPYLDAVVMEGLRCFPAIPMSLPRYVPKGGRTIDSYFVPEGTIVSCQAYSVHRMNGTVFPDPDRFDPGRWLVEGDAERRKGMFAFASGGRGCIGKHLAVAEMKTLLRQVYSRFETLPDPAMKAQDMAMHDELISSRPKSQRCLLKFVPVHR